MRIGLYQRSGRLLPALFIVLGGCAAVPEDVRIFDPQGATELTDTPFFPQRRLQCGPAALTTVLAASGANVSLREIEGKVFLPGRGGSLQVELLAAARTAGRLPYVIDGTMSALGAELAAGRPVIVLQNLGIAALPRWHYAVVVGIDPQRDQLVLRSGTERRRLTGISTFLRTWRRSDYWAMVVLRPDQRPARVDRGRYLEAIAALEQAGRLEEAFVAWNTALAMWPADPVATFGLANVHLAQGRFGDAERLYRALLAQDGGLLAARNNLALALARQGRFADALRAVDAALDAAADAAMRDELAHTRAEIERLASAARRLPLE